MIRTYNECNQCRDSELARERCRSLLIVLDTYARAYVPTYMHSVFNVSRIVILIPLTKKTICKMVTITLV